ncbi:MAG: NADPH-dependent oxidoreductase [Burkholderiales bacterium]
MTPLRDALTRRHGGADPTHDAVAERAAPVLETLLAHRSVRAYLPDALPEGTLETLVAAAQSAATSSNLQAWSVVAVEDAARRARLSELVGGQAHVREAPLFLAWIADLSRLARTAEGQGRTAGANRYLEMFLVAAVDAALAAQNAVVAAESMGLGTVYIGAMRNRPDEVAAELRLPQGAFAVFGLCVGRPDPSRPASVKPRLAPRTVLHRETYATDGEPEAVAAYDETMRAFQRSQHMTEQAWSAQSSQRVAGPESLSGRHRLAALLKAQGFGLE